MKEFLIYCPHCNKATRATELHAGDRLCAICGKTFTITPSYFIALQILENMNAKTTKPLG